MGELSDPFTAMAERIAINKDQQFGGALVIVPPGEDVKPVELLMLDNSGNASLFLGTAMTMIQMALQIIADEEAKGSGFGGLGRR